MKSYQLCPSSHQTHQERAKEDQQTRNDPLFASQNLPALVAQEVFRHEFNKRGENEKACRHSIHDADDEKTNLRVGAVESVCRDADSHAAGCAVYDIS